jgi:hypothetical protein
MASEIIGPCVLCAEPLTSLPKLGLVSVTRYADHVSYTKACSKSPNGHLLSLDLGVPGVPPVITDKIGQWAVGVHEAEQRKRNRRIAEAHQKELAEHRGHQAVTGQWHEGTCKGCGMENQQVIGVPGSEYCTYCEDLRVMAPTPVPELNPAAREPRTRMLAASVLLAVVGILLTFSGAPALLCAAILATAFLTGKAA